MPRLALFLLFALPIAAAPVPTGMKKAQPPPLAGTVWVCEGVGRQVGVRRVTFEADGTLAFTCDREPEAKYNDFWTQNEGALAWSLNDGHSKYKLVFESGGWVGSARNVYGREWTARLTPDVKK